MPATATGRAVKCDHCRGYADEACVQNCPVHSILWVDPLTFFRNAAAGRVYQ